MKAPNLALGLPSDVIIFRTPGSGARNSSIHGRIVCNNFNTSNSYKISAQIKIVRSGTFLAARPTSNESSPWYQRYSRQFVSEREMPELNHAEKLVDCTVEMKSELSGAFTSTFELVIPSSFSPTIALPSVEVFYAVVAQTVLPSGQSLYAHQILRISKRWLELPSLMPSPRITFPESPLAVKVRFANQDTQTRHLPITLHLKGLDSPSCGASSVPSVSWVRQSEVRKMTPRTIQWELEEKAIVISGPSTDGNMLAMSDTIRSEQARIISKGKYQPVLHYPFKTVAGTEAESEVDIQFNAHIPKDTELPDAGKLTIFSDRLVHTVSCSNPGPDSAARREPGARFAVHVEHSLRICIHMGEDTFHKMTESLVHRRPAQFAYTVVVPLKVVQETSSGGDSEWVTGLPTYEAAVDSRPT